MHEEESSRQLQVREDSETIIYRACSVKIYVDYLEYREIYNAREIFSIKGYMVEERFAWKFVLLNEVLCPLNISSNKNSQICKSDFSDEAQKVSFIRLQCDSHSCSLYLDVKRRDLHWQRIHISCDRRSIENDINCQLRRLTGVVNGRKRFWKSYYIHIYNDNDCMTKQRDIFSSNRFITTFYRRVQRNTLFRLSIVLEVLCARRQQIYRRNA